MKESNSKNALKTPSAKSRRICRWPVSTGVPLDYYGPMHLYVGGRNSPALFWLQKIMPGYTTQ
jgi:hypothetical protein